MADEDKLVKELRLVRESINEYTKQSVETRSRRRAETIQVLVSLGVVGGFISLYVQDEISNSPYSVVVWLLAVTSGVFVLSKTLLPPLSQIEVFKKTTLEKLDLIWMQLVYTFFISLSLLLGIILGVSQILSEIEYSPPENALLTIQILIILSSLFLTLRSVGRYRQEYQQEQARRVRFSGVVDDSYTEMELMDRLVDDHEIWEQIGVQSIVGRQYRIGNVRPDFLAVDQDGEPVIVELIAREVTPNEIERVKQYIRAYRQEQGEDVRAIIIGVHITSKAELLVKNDKNVEYVEYDISSDDSES